MPMARKDAAPYLISIFFEGNGETAHGSANASNDAENLPIDEGNQSTFLFRTKALTMNQFHLLEKGRSNHKGSSASVLHSSLHLLSRLSIACSSAHAGRNRFRNQWRNWRLTQEKKFSFVHILSTHLFQVTIDVLIDDFLFVQTAIAHVGFTARNRELVEHRFVKGVYRRYSLKTTRWKKKTY